MLVLHLIDLDDGCRASQHRRKGDVKVGQEGNIKHGPTSALNLFHTITTKTVGAGINSIE
jgi:hypothetical protein